MSAPHYYTLEIHYVNRAPELRRFESPRVVIGRDGGDIVLGDSQASAAHAEIEFQNGQLVVRDLGSTNGTWLGERQLPQFALSPGQSFRCGHTHMRLMEIVGGQQLTAGRTIMADGGALPTVPMHAPAPGPAPAQGPIGYAGQAPYPAHGSPAPAPAQAPAPANSGPGAGAIIGATLGGLALLAAVGGGASYLLSRDDDELAANEPGETPDSEASETSGTPEQTETSGEPETLAPEDPDLGELYRKVGAATVVVRVPGSVGSGAVIDPSGIILTNHHVIEGGKREGLSLKAKVVFGDYSEELRTFEPRHEQLDAWVIKIDEDHDLALIKLVEPPAGLTHISVAADNPYPGQRVAAIGHAGVGMLWAIKGGEISATGSLSGHTELLLDAHEGDREYLEQTKKRFEKMGRVIQSTAKILPGDSGGPLVNLTSEIVGVNAFGRIDQGTNQWLSFHIHRAEVANFVADLPTRPLAVIPDAWDHAGSWSRVEDANLDGDADVLLLAGASGSGGGGGYDWEHSGVLIDLDDDSFTSEGSPTAVNARIEDIVETKSIDAEFAVLHEPGGASHYWYDRDGVDGFDLYLVDELGAGSPNKAWSLDAHGGADVVDELELGNGLRPELFTKPELQAAFRTIGSVVFPGQIEAGSGPTSAGNIPIPSHQLDAAAAFVDGDGDELNDTIIETSSFDQRLFIDLDQNSIARTTSLEALKVLLEVASVDAELAAIYQGKAVWVWYDRDDDGSFDLVLHSHDLAAGIVHEAYALGGTSPGPAPEHIGRRLMRPALLAKPELAARLGANAAMLPAGPPPDDALASFPSLAPTDTASILIQDQVALVAGLGRDLVLVDVDGDSSEGSKQVVAGRVRSGSYDAEFALLNLAGVEWAFYDRDGDGRFDYVGISLDSSHDTSTHVYELDAGRATSRPEAAGGALIGWGIFPDPGARDAFEPIARSLWPERARAR